MEPVRWTVDEMLGRLARYLRFVGYDTEYLRGVSDDEILQRLARSGRRLITRDRQLAGRAPGSVLLRALGLEEQWRELRTLVPGLSHEVRFVRCSECNGRLTPYLRGTDPSRERALPSASTHRPDELFGCSVCGHLYWDGSHTRAIRSLLRRWSEEGPAPSR